MYTINDDVCEIDSRLSVSGISFKGKHILVTGGAGFLGSWICDLLIKQGANLVCIDNLSSGKWDNIKHLVELPNFTFINHDISVPTYFGRIVPNHFCYPHITKRFDIVMHLASRASPFEFKEHPIQILRSNTLGTLNALGIARDHNALFFYSSTSEVYGNPPKEAVPTSEEYFGHVNPVGPRSCYDEAKRAGEAFVKAFELQHGLKARIVRIFNTYGPKIRSGKEYGRVVPNFITQALNNDPITIFGDGSQTRSFTYVVDEVEGILRLISAGCEVDGMPINIGNNIMNTVKELAEAVVELTGSKSEIIYHPLPIDDPLLRQPVLEKANKYLGWKPTTPLKEGLRKTIEWFKTLDGCDY
jgi:UDP-glucuronate decarboxylase